MARLIVESGSEAGMVYPLKGEAVTIGRSASSTIQIVDKRVSRHHVVLRLNRDSYVVEDLGSKNGTYVNDRPLAGRMKLKTSDRIQVGDTIFIYEREPDDPMARSGETTRSGAVKLVAEDVATPQGKYPLERLPGGGTEVNEPVSREVLRDPLERIKVLYQVADSLRSELEIDELLRKIMDILWKVVSPYRGVILLREESDNTLEPVVVRTRDGQLEEVSISRGVVERCINEKVSVLISDAPSDLRFAANESLIVSRVRSVICAPLVCKGEVLGVIYIDSQDVSHVYYTDEELELVSGIANQAALAITNARLHRQAIERQKLEKELEIARSIQVNLLPKEFPALPGVTFSALSLPARKVGGDFYDFVDFEDGRVAIVIADVSGKGIPAAILTATIRSSVRLETQRAGTQPVNEIVSAINRWTCRDASNNMFVTMAYAVYDPRTKTIEYTNAGHCFPLVFKPDGQYRALDKGGCFLGIMEQLDYECERFEIEPGDTLIFYTDGLTDSHNADNQILGTEQLIEVIRKNLTLPAEELRDEIYEATLEFRRGQEQFDDLTLLVAKF